MTESVILSNPWLTFLLGLAFVIQLVLQQKQCRGMFVELLPAFLCVGTLLASLLLGATLTELSLVLCAFFVLSLTQIGKKNEGGEV